MAMDFFDQVRLSLLSRLLSKHIGIRKNQNSMCGCSSESTKAKTVNAKKTFGDVHALPVVQQLLSTASTSKT